MKDAFFSFLISSSSGVTSSGVTIQVPISQQQKFTPCFRALKQAKHMMPFYHTLISNTKFDWRDCQMMTWRGHFKDIVFFPSMDTATLKALGYPFYAWKCPNSPIAQKVAVISFYAFVLKPQSNQNWNQNCFSRCVFTALPVKVQIIADSFPTIARWFSNPSSTPDLLSVLFYSLLCASK